MKKIASAVVVAVAAIFLYQKLGAPPPTSFRYSSVSPDKRYRADVYSEATPVTMPGQGGAGSRPATIIVLNDRGWKVGSNDGCELLMDDVQIEWDEKNNRVNIAKARAIDLSTGRCVE